MSKLVPGQSAPDFTVNLADGSRWRLSENAPDYMLMIDIYRGYHCPRCWGHLEAISAAADDFKTAKMDVIGISVDSSEGCEIVSGVEDCQRQDRRRTGAGGCRQARPLSQSCD